MKEGNEGNIPQSTINGDIIPTKELITSLNEYNPVVSNLVYR